MFNQKSEQSDNHIIDGEFREDGYVSVFLNGQVYSRKVKSNGTSTYIEIDGVRYGQHDFLRQNP